METEELQRILKSGGIEPVKSFELSKGLESAYRKYQIAVISGTVRSANKIANIFKKISDLASLLSG
jgi:hypothetical protein